MHSFLSLASTTYKESWGQLKMTRILIIVLIIISTSCQQKSRVFPDCDCEHVDLKNGLIINDTLNHCQIKYPAELHL